MTKNSNADKLHVVDAIAPNSLGLKLRLKKALAKAESREYAILSHENLHKDIKAIIRPRFSIEPAVELAIARKESFAHIWEIPKKDVDMKEFFNVGINLPGLWLKGDSLILYKMCISENVPVQALMYVPGSGGFASLVIDITKLKSNYEK